jgi:RNA polymerase sigma factor for flagellar operon FliA
MATEMGMSVDEFFILEGKVQSVQHVSIDFDDSEGGRSFLETFADEHQLTGEELVMQDDFREQVRQAISELSDRKRDCILLYYGRNLNLSEIAAVFDITSSRVSQILSAARIELKANLQEVASLYGFVTDEIE